VPDLWADSLDEHRSLVRRRLLRAFGELAAEMPVDDITVTAVAERAGIARSAVYNYVASRHDLLLEYTLDVASDWAARLARDAVGPVEARLEQFVVATLRVFADDPIAGHDDPTRPGTAQHARLMTALGPVHDHLSSLVAEGVSDGTFAGDPRELAGFVFATLAGYRARAAAGGLDPVATGTLVTRLLLRGLQGPATAGAAVDGATTAAGNGPPEPGGLAAPPSGPTRITRRGPAGRR
jgi:AcrR family transcriptional regulator